MTQSGIHFLGLLRFLFVVWEFGTPMYNSTFKQGRQRMWITRSAEVGTNQTECSCPAYSPLQVFCWIFCNFLRTRVMEDTEWVVIYAIKTLESPLDCKEIQPVHPKGNQSWIFIGRTDAEAETPILWPPDRKNWLIGKDLDSGKDWRQGKKGMIEDEMVGWHCRLDGHEFEQALGVCDGQGSLMCCNPWGCKESDMTW